MYLVLKYSQYRNKKNFSRTLFSFLLLIVFVIVLVINCICKINYLSNITKL